MNNDRQQQHDQSPVLVVLLSQAHATVKELQERLRQHELNPPMGSRALVGDFTLEVWKVLAELIMGPQLTGMGVDAEFLMGNYETLNTTLRERGGIPATLLAPATGGSRPPLLTIEDVMGVLSVASPPADDFAVAERLRELAGAPTFRVDPVHPNPPASTKAQIISAKLLQRPELAEEVFRLLMVDFTPGRKR